MTTSFSPAIGEIRQAFVDEVSDLGGTLTDVFEEGQSLFMRSTFPQTALVRPKDAVNRGAALRATERDVMIHPYIFRQMCANGALMAQVSGTCQILRLDAEAPQEEIDRVLEDVRVMVRASSDEIAFANSVDAMRSAAETPGDIDILISIIGVFSNSGYQQEMMRMLLKNFSDEGDRSQFGVVNAVTAVARETPDSETRWRLEELGGGILATLLPDPAPLEPAMADCC